MAIAWYAYQSLVIGDLSVRGSGLAVCLHTPYVRLFGLAARVLGQLGQDKPRLAVLRANKQRTALMLLASTFSSKSTQAAQGRFTSGWGH